MKKTAVVFAALLAAFVLAACTTERPPVDDLTPPVEDGAFLPQEESPDEPPADDGENEAPTLDKEAIRAASKPSEEAETAVDYALLKGKTRHYAVWRMRDDAKSEGDENLYRYAVTVYENGKKMADLDLPFDYDAALSPEPAEAVTEADVNFDGVPDIVWTKRVNAIHGTVFYGAYVWEGDAYRSFFDIEEIPNLRIDPFVKTFVGQDASETYFMLCKYRYEDGRAVKVKEVRQSLDMFSEEETWEYVVGDLVDGIWEEKTLREGEDDVAISRIDRLSFTGERPVLLPVEDQ